MEKTIILSDDYAFATIQGECRYTGLPAVFLRLALCNLTCIGYKSPGAPFGCDTYNQWNTKHEMTFEELNAYFEMHGYVDAIKNGSRLIITGGEPLIQSSVLGEWLAQFIKKYQISKIEIDFETNGTIAPEQFRTSFFTLLAGDVSFINKIGINFVICPKLSTNGDPEFKRYKPEVLKYYNKQYDLGTVDFKFVVNTEEDIKEIKEKYIESGLIDEDKIWLMPTAGCREELIERSEKVANWCIQNNWKFSNRLHIMIWDTLKRV